MTGFRRTQKMPLILSSDAEKECLSTGPCRVFSTTCWRASVVRIFYSSSPIFWFIQFTLGLIMPLPGLWMIYQSFLYFNILINSIHFGLETVGTDWRLFIGTLIWSEYISSLSQSNWISIFQRCISSSWGGLSFCLFSQVFLIVCSCKIFNHLIKVYTYLNASHVHWYFNFGRILDLEEEKTYYFSVFFFNPIANYHFVLKILISNSCPDYCLFNLYQSYCLFQSIITQVVYISILNLFSFHSIFLIVSITVERWQVCKKLFFFLSIFLHIFYDA